jgi:hypothetical protein
VSLTTSNDEAQAQVTASDRARLAAAQARLAAAQATVLAKNASATASERAQYAREWATPRIVEAIYQARGWAAPRIGQAGQAVGETVGPKVSEMLATTAQRVDPTPPAAGRRIWPRLIASVAVLAAAGGAVAVILRGRSAGTADTLMAEEEMVPAPSGPDTAATEERVMADGDVAGNAKKAGS